MKILWASVVAPSLNLLALVAALAGAVLGACLLVRSEPTLRAMRAMNRWVSSRRALKPLEVPRAMGGRVQGRSFWLGLLLAAAGAYVLIVLVWYFDAARLVAVLRGGAPTAIFVDTARWALVAGSLLCIGVGLLLALAPRALQAFEAWSNRWISTRRAAQGSDQLYLPLDGLVERYPRVSGALLLVLSLAAVAASALLLQR